MMLNDNWKDQVRARHCSTQLLSQYSGWVGASCVQKQPGPRVEKFVPQKQKLKGPVIKNNISEGNPVSPH